MRICFASAVSRTQPKLKLWEQVGILMAVRECCMVENVKSHLPQFISEELAKLINAA
jgi:hypothetical protein